MDERPDLLLAWLECDTGGESLHGTDPISTPAEPLASLAELRRFVLGMDRLAEAPSDEVLIESTVPPRLTELPRIPGFDVTAVLGAGGMGVVYRAFHHGLQREVALKLIRPECLTDELRQRFTIEARAVARLCHPNILQVYEVNEYQPPGSSVVLPYIVFEYAAGGSLANRIGNQPIDPSEAARLVRLLARAMHHVHEHGIVHRDLNPANVFLAPPSDVAELNTSWGCPKIGDFGLARREAASGVTGTLPGMVLGTPAYMAPEQAQGQPTGPAADLYALGAILYRLLTGCPVFDAKTRVDLLYQVCTAPPRPPGERVGNLPPGLEALCLRCLSKQPQDRPTATELAAELEPFASADPLTTTLTNNRRPSDVRQREAIKVDRSTTTATYPPRPFSNQARRRLLIGGSVLVGVIFAAVLLGWWLTRPPVVPLKGYLDAEMTRQGDHLRQNKHLNDPAALPLRPGDFIRVHVELNRPAYSYLVWVDTAGKVTPMYPWIDGDWKQRGPEVKAAIHKLPQLDSAWEYWPMGPGKRGLETMVLLCRDEPLPAETDLEAILGEFGPQPLDGQDLGVVAWFENGETVHDEQMRAPLAKPVKGGNPLERVNRAIHRRVKGLFGYTRAITYVNEGDRP